MRALEYISTRLKAKILGERLKDEETVDKRKPVSLKRKRSTDHYDVKCKRLKLESKEDKIEKSIIEPAKRKPGNKIDKSVQVSAPAKQNIPRVKKKRKSIARKVKKVVAAKKSLRLKKKSAMKKLSRSVGKLRKKSKRKIKRRKKAFKTLTKRDLAKMPKYFVVVDPSSDEELHRPSPKRKKKIH